MLAIILGWLAKLLSGFAVGVVREKDATVEAETVGATKQALATEEQANAAVKVAEVARDNVVPLTPASLSNIKAGSDPDFRD